MKGKILCHAESVVETRVLKRRQAEIIKNRWLKTIVSMKLELI